MAKKITWALFIGLWVLIFIQGARAADIPAYSQLFMNDAQPLGNTVDTFGFRALHTIIGNTSLNPASVSCSQSGTWTVQQGNPPWSVSQSGAWTVTANAGTNLNTSALALQTGVNSNLDKSASGSISALNGAVTVATNGMSTAYLAATGTWVGALSFEGQDATGNWTGTFGMLPFSTLIGDLVSNGTVVVPVGGFVQFRVRAIAWTSGTATVSINASTGTQAIQVINLTPSNLQVVANAGTNLNTSALALDTSVTGLQVSQGSTTSGQKGDLIQGAVTTNQPTYTTAQTSPLSLTVRGGLRAKVIGLDNVTLIRNDYSSVNVTTSAYVQLVASTSLEINRLHIFDSSGQDFVLAVGGAGSEVDQIQIPPGGWDASVELYIPSGSRISIKSKSATASSGILLITGLK